MSKSVLFGILRWVAVALVVVLVASMLGQNRISDADPALVEKAVLDKVELLEMERADDQMVKRLYGLNPADFEACVLYYSPNNFVNCEELLIVKLKDVSQQDAVNTAIVNRHETQKATMNGYAPALYDMLTGHYDIVLRGNYVLFVVHPNAERAVRAFEDAL